ncbi:MAG: response regulator [Mucilaginibacter sp.]|nr:response regulator [Mucilaginibacter sp.]
MRDKVLVIEDEPVIGEMMCILLEIEGYKVISLNDTASALRKLKAEEVALVMLDLNLAGEDGRDVCRYIKGQSDLQHTPVILVSSSPDLPQIKDECGADDYIAKPFELTDFVQKVKDFTDSNRASNVA